MDAHRERKGRTMQDDPGRYPAGGEAAWVEGEVDPRGTAFPSINTPREDYLTTWQLAQELGQYTETVFRWCKKWFGDLPSGRGGGGGREGQGYRIPLEYRRVARGYLQTQDPKTRALLRKALVREPRDWVVIADNVATTHLTRAETIVRLQSILEHGSLPSQPIHVLYVGTQ